MSLKDILVLLDAQNASKDRLCLAVTIAREHGAYLTAAFVSGDGDAELGSGRRTHEHMLLPGFPDPMALGTSQVLDLADAAESRFYEQLRMAGIDGQWHVWHGANDEDLILRAQAADLIILGQMHPGRVSGRSFRPQRIVVKSGRPALLVPYVGTYRQVGRRVLIAWDGSREAVRALHDALPLIARAQEVTVMMVRRRERDFDRDRLSLDRAVADLARHGVTARAVEQRNYGEAIFNVLLSSTVDIAADMIVAGAYHHSQLREAVVGGVSRGLFAHMTVPVLMSH